MSLLSEKEASNAEVQLARDKVTNGEWGGIGNGIALSIYGHSLLLYLLKLWGLGQSPIRYFPYIFPSGLEIRVPIGKDEPIKPSTKRLKRSGKYLKFFLEMTTKNVVVIG